MGFFDEITSLFKEEKFDNSYQLQCFGNSALMVSGYKKIMALSENEIKLTVERNKVIEVTGAKMYVKKLEPEEMVIAGTIMKIEIVSGGNCNDKT